jgi:hypothetical protein
MPEPIPPTPPGPVPVRAVYVVTTMPRPRHTPRSIARGVRAVAALLTSAGVALAGAALGLPCAAWWRNCATSVRQAVREHRAEGGA